MKQKIFTLVMMLALVIMAGSAMAQDKWTPYPKGTYTYTIPYVLANAGSATLNASHATMDITVTTPASGLLTGLSAGTANVVFTIAYDEAAPAGTQTITFVLTDGTSNCTNTIIAEVDIQALPAIDLTIAASIANTCQERNSSPADNVAETVNPDNPNSFTFVVTPDITSPPSVYGYTYDITFTGGEGVLTAFTVAYTGAGAYVGDDTGGTVTCDEGDAEATGTFTITFTTTSGIATENVEAVISAGLLTETSGGGTYDATYTDDTDDVDVLAVPSISPIN